MNTFLILDSSEPLAIHIIDAIHHGHVDKLAEILRKHPETANARIRSKSTTNAELRSLLHIAVDWPGHFQHVAETIRLLVQAGADVHARFEGFHNETPLHWAASCNDVEAVDALIKAGADLEADGAVIANGTPLDDAVAFGQWDAAQRLVELGASMAAWHAAALGRLDLLKKHYTGSNPLPVRYPWGTMKDVNAFVSSISFWCACHGNQLPCAKYLLQQGADKNWISSWDGLTPLDAAIRSRADQVVKWLQGLGAKKAEELKAID